MKNINQIIDKIEHGIETLKFPEEPGNLYAPIKYTLEAGGKRFRPVMVVIASQMYNTDIEKALKCAIAIEIFHNFTLLHDDIMDNAPSRRGRESVHIKWNHNVAILSGDAMIFYAYKLLAQSCTERFEEIVEEFNKLASLVCEGQQIDMDFESRDDVSIPEYINMITLKTSALIAGALKIGALAGNAPKSECDKLYEYGINLGIAFQLQDDLLDTYGNPENFGKRIGGDILEGKKTFLLANLMNMASDEDKIALSKLLCDCSKDFESQKIEKVRELYNKYNIRKLTEDTISHYFKLSIETLDSIDLESDKKKDMYKLSTLIMKRDK